LKNENGADLAMKPAAAQLLAQRSVGAITFTLSKFGPQILREVGASKLRLPQGSTQAIIINTGGGLAGGDKFKHHFTCGPDAALTLTSQAAERVYQTLGPAAVIETKLTAEQGAQFFWLPQETILYDGASLARTYDVKMAEDATFLAIEPVVFGRVEMGETIKSVHLKDRWRIWRGDRLIHGDDVALGPNLPHSKATLRGAAMATLIYVSPHAETYIERLQKICACSAWNGKLVARFSAKDGFTLRKALIPAINALAGKEALPKIWTA
jgi:urease accessory protein